METIRKTTRRKQAEETKVQLFNTALQMLDEREFDDITVRDIVKAANVSIGTFYNYYATKIDVFYETYQLADEYFEDTVAGKLNQATVCEKILRFFDYYAKYSTEITNIKLTKLLYNANNKYFERHSEIGMFPILTKLMQEGLDNGELHSNDTAQNMAHFFLIAVRGLVYNWCTHDGDYDLCQAMEEYVSLLLRIYCPAK